MEIFESSGHITDAGLDAIIKGTLNEMQSLETSEHLSFCDECLLRYTSRLEDSILIAPLENLAPTVLKKVRRRNIKVLFRKYGTVAAAMAFAMTLWSVGAFTNLIPVADATDTAKVQRQDTLLNKAGDFVAEVGDKIGGTLNGVFGLEKKAADAKTPSALDKAKASAEDIKAKNAAKIAQEKAKADKAAQEEKAKADKAAQEEKTKADKAAQDKAKTDKEAEGKGRRSEQETGDKAIESLRNKDDILSKLKNIILMQ